MNLVSYLLLHWRVIALYGYAIPLVLAMLWMIFGIVDQLKQDVKWSEDRHNYPITKWGDLFTMVAMPFVPFLNIFIVYVSIHVIVEHIWNKTVIANKVELDFSDYEKRT